jgi:hypothetical protein
MSDRSFSRRDFLLTIGAAGAASAALAGCEPAAPPADQPPTAETMPPTAEPTNGVVAAECPGYDQLSDADLSVRRTLNYADVTPEPGQYCHNCRFKIEGDEWGECIGCQLFPGPVAPEGWCSSWAAEA